MESKRRSPRTVLNRILCIQIIPENHAIVVDISDDGLGFHAVYPVTDSGLIRFSFQNSAGRRVEACGELVWTDPAKKSGGLRFVYLPQLRREPLRNWIAEAQLPPSPEEKPPAPQTPAPSHRNEEMHPSAPAPQEASAAPRPDERSAPLPRPPRASSAPGRLRPHAHWPLHPPPELPPESDDAARLATGSAAWPVVPEPEPATPQTEPDGLGFVLLGDDSPQEPGSFSDPRMASPRTRSRFASGFLTGAIFSAILAAILVFAYGNPAGDLQSLVKVWRNVASEVQGAPAPASPAASAAPPAAPASQPPAPPVSSAASSQAAPPAASGTGQQVAGAGNLPVANAEKEGAGPGDATVAAAAAQPVVSTSGLDPGASSNANAVKAKPATEAAPPSAPAAVTAPPASTAPAPGAAREDLAIAQRYLSERTAAGDRAAAAFLWAAVAKGSVAAELTLADLYARGKGVQKSCGQARVLLQTASENGPSQEFQDLSPAILRICR